MTVRIKCPSCAEVMAVGSEAVGDTFPCRVCGQRLRVPAPPPVDDFPLADVLPDEPRPRRRDDDYDNPPLRRRRPARQPGRGVALTLLLGCGGLGLVAVLGCGGLFMAFGTAHWRTHTSDRGGFRVDLPAAPRDDLAELAKAPVGPGMTVEGTILILRGEDYAVIYADLPPNQAAVGTDALLDEAIAGMARGPNPGRVTKQHPITVSGFPGREIVVEIEGKGNAVGRVVIADRRVFVVIAGGPFSTPDNPRVRRFLDSFAIPDPARMPGAAARR